MYSVQGTSKKYTSWVVENPKFDIISSKRHGVVARLPVGWVMNGPCFAKGRWARRQMKREKGGWWLARALDVFINYARSGLVVCDGDNGQTGR